MVWVEPDGPVLGFWMLLTSAGSSFHSTWSTPEGVSVPLIVAVYPLPTAEDGAGVVVLVGLTLSMSTSSGRQADALPAASMTRVSSVCVPVPPTVACSGAGPPRVIGPASTRHSSQRTPDPLS